MTDIIEWPGMSSATYRYWFEPGISAAFKDEGGNYMFVKPSGIGKWLPVYIGQASNLKSRLPNHERWADAQRAGATHVMGHTTPAGERARLDEEADLIGYWNPPLNTQMRQVS